MERRMGRWTLNQLLWFMCIMVLVLFGLNAFIGIAGYISLSNRADENTTARYALCALRRARVDQVNQAKHFLLTHPNGGFGFSRNDILANIKLEQSTVDSLSILHCPPDN